MNKKQFTVSLRDSVNEKVSDMRLEVEYTSSNSFTVEDEDTLSALEEEVLEGVEYEMEDVEENE